MCSKQLLVSLLASLALPCLAAAQPESKPSDRTKSKPRPKRGPIVRPIARPTMALGAGPGGKWGGRLSGRRRLARNSAAAAQAIERGLEWLSKHQEEDGGWKVATFMRYDSGGEKADELGVFIGRVGLTACCMLAFLGDGHTLRRGDYATHVRKAVVWLRKQQQDSGTYSSRVLEHVLATYAMSEACGLSRSSILRDETRTSLEYLAAQQNDDGGWSHEAKGKPSEAFVTCHAVLAYQTGVDFRLVEEIVALKRAATWLDKVTREDGTLSVIDRCPITLGSRPSETAAACGLLTRFFLGQHPGLTPAMGEAAKILADPKSRAPDAVFDYVASHGLFQMGGPHWTQLQRRVTKSMTNRQRDDGDFKGSWAAVSPGVRRGGRVYATALSILTLEAPYRYTRLVR